MMVPELVDLREAVREDLTVFLDDYVEKTEERIERMRRINEFLRPGLREAYLDIISDQSQSYR